MLNRCFGADHSRDAESTRRREGPWHVPEALWKGLHLPNNTFGRLGDPRGRGPRKVDMIDHVRGRFLDVPQRARM